MKLVQPSSYVTEVGKEPFVRERFQLLPSSVERLRSTSWSFGFGAFSEIVFQDNYAQKKLDGQLETWPDVIQRVVEGCMSIRKDHYLRQRLRWDERKWQEVAEEMALAFLQLKSGPPGRGYFAMGRDFAYERGGMALINCCATKLHPESLDRDLGWIMDCLMCGGGVGVECVDDPTLLLTLTQPEGEEELYVVPDSREGWVESLELLVRSYQGLLGPVSFDYTGLRARGTPIKKFGGTASGPEPLIHLHEFVRETLDRFVKREISVVRLKADLVCAIGCCVVAGNVRRSACALLGSPDDKEFLDLKDYTKYPEREAIGWMSNNSPRLSEPRHFALIPEIAARARVNGEPGLVNMIAMRRYGRVGKGEQPDPADLLNPCFEIPLCDKETCNLSECYPSRCANEDEFVRAAELACLYSSTVTLLPTHRPETNAIVARNRRIGVGLSGVADWGAQVQVADQIKAMRRAYRAVIDYNRELAHEAGIPSSIRCSTVKPSGCWKRDSLISTENGIYRFDELVSMEESGWQTPLYYQQVQTRFGLRRVLRHFNNGRKPTKKIVTSDGFELEVTHQHPLLVERNGEMSWTKASDLMEGDRLVARLGQYMKTKESGLSMKIMEGDGRTNRFTGPSEMSPDLAWFLGVMWGNGSVHENGIRISTNPKQAGLIKWLVSFGERVFGFTPTVDDRHAVYFSSGALLDWLKENGLLKHYSEDLRTPKAIRTASADSIRAFISGVWRTDGGIHNQTTWSVCTVSKEFAQEFLVLARAVGMNLQAKNAGPGEWGSLDRWILNSRDVGNPATSRYVSRAMRGRQIGEGLWADPIVKIVDSEAETLDVEVEDVHEYTAQGFVSHNSVALLAGVSPGGHFALGKHYLRRKRVSTDSPLVPLLDAAGYRRENDVKTPNTYVYEFPIAQPGVRTQAEAGMFEQALQLATLQREWSDNSVSFTLEFDPVTEGPRLANLLAQIAPTVKTVSMFPRDTKAYVQAPYEEIGEAEFERRAALVRPVDWTAYGKHGGRAGDGEADLYCSGGICQIRKERRGES